MNSSDRAWLALASGVAAYDMTCQPGETLSEAVSRYRRRHPILTVGAVVYIAAHLLDLLPERIDLLHAATLLRHR